MCVRTRGQGPVSCCTSHMHHTVVFFRSWRVPVSSLPQPAGICSKAAVHRAAPAAIDAARLCGLHICAGEAAAAAGELPVLCTWYNNRCSVKKTHAYAGLLVVAGLLRLLPGHAGAHAGCLCDAAALPKQGGGTCRSQHQLACGWAWHPGLLCQPVLGWPAREADCAAVRAAQLLWTYSAPLLAPAAACMRATPLGLMPAQPQLADRPPAPQHVA